MLLKEKKKMQYHILRQVTHIMQNVIGLLMERDSNFNVKKKESNMEGRRPK